MPIKLMEQVVDAASRRARSLELLQIRARSPLLFFERTYFAASGEPVEYTNTWQTCRRYPYRIVLSRSGPAKLAPPHVVPDQGSTSAELSPTSCSSRPPVSCAPPSD